MDSLLDLRPPAHIYEDNAEPGQAFRAAEPPWAQRLNERQRRDPVAHDCDGPRGVGAAEMLAITINLCLSEGRPVSLRQIIRWPPYDARSKDEREGQRKRETRDLAPNG